MPKPTVKWTPGAIEKLERGIRNREPASKIAQQIPGATRCAIIGKAHRLGLCWSAPPPELPPEPVKATPIVIARDPKKDPTLCAMPGCTKTRVRPYPHCQHHDQERIAAKKHAA
jgi:hypothetical protein